MIFYCLHPQKTHISQIEDLLKALLKMDLRYPEESVNYSKQNYNTWAVSYL